MGKPENGDIIGLTLLQSMANVAGLTVSKIELKRAKQDLEAEKTKQQLMVAELHHRFRNQLNVILAICRQTMKSTCSWKSSPGRFPVGCRRSGALRHS